MIEINENDLGVVNNKQTGSKDPVGVSSGIEIGPGYLIESISDSLGEAWSWVKWILGILLGLLGIGLIVLCIYGVIRVYDVFVKAKDVRIREKQLKTKQRGKRK